MNTLRALQLIGIVGKALSGVSLIGMAGVDFKNFLDTAPAAIEASDDDLDADLSSDDFTEVK